MTRNRGRFRADRRPHWGEGWRLETSRAAWQQPAGQIPPGRPSTDVGWSLRHCGLNPTYVSSREEDQVDASAPTFLTHRELDLFLGGGERGPKKRQRLRRENLLPDPADLGRVKRINIAMFPRFALAGLVGDLTRLDGAPECLSDLTRQALGLRVFSQLTKAVLVSVRAMDGWRFDQLIDDVGDLAQPAVAEWNACINAAESELQQRFGIAFSTACGVIERVNSGICVVSLAEGGPRPSTPTAWRRLWKRDVQ
jgi:hypothetical protein